MDDRIERLLQRMESTQGKVGKTMWYMVFTDALLDLLPAKGSFTHAELRGELTSRMAKHSDQDLFRNAYEEAIAQLDAHAVKAD